MKTAQCILACVAGTAAVVICSSLTASAQVATVVCAAEGAHPVKLGPGEHFVLTCQNPFDKPAPDNYHIQACSGTGANCKDPKPYATLFPKASSHVWVSPATAGIDAHTWTAPPASMLGEKTVFSVGCRTGENEAAKYCSVDVTVSSAMKRVVSGIVLAVCSFASLAVL